MKQFINELLQTIYHILTSNRVGSWLFIFDFLVYVENNGPSI